jgi:pyridoxal phosphate enzyme (YggS family)
MNRVADNLAAVRERVEAAARRAGRDPSSVTLVAVSKRHGADSIREAVAAGHRDFGENYAQEFAQKVRELEGLPVRWHYIGHLQTNKARLVASDAALVHTVDSAHLAAELDKRASAAGRRLAVLIQVNVAGEEQKSGCEPEELPALLQSAGALTHLDVRGLMTMPPFWPAERVRPFFAALRDLRDRHATDACPLRELSMGMSEDFEAAIEEGATIVRVGTAIFGPRA